MQIFIVLLQHEIPLETVARAIKLLIIIVYLFLNSAPAFPIERNLLSKVDFITPNEHEAAMILGIDSNENKDPHWLANQLIEKGCRQVIITLGEKGVLYATSNQVELISALSVNAVDTTAAGDVFNGYFAFEIAIGKTVVEAIRIANKAAAISVTRLGAQSSIPFFSN